MTNVLVINSSAILEGSASRQLVADLVGRIQAGSPEVNIVHRDVGADPLPHLTPATVGALGRGTLESDSALATRALSDRLIAELQAADVLVVGAPMYNFGITSTLKAWFDHVLRAGATFAYTADGPKGLVTGKRAIVVETRGGFYSDGPAKAYDAQEPHLRAMLGLMGITDVTFIRAERLAIDPATRAEAIAAATGLLHELADAGLARAA